MGYNGEPRNRSTKKYSQPWQRSKGNIMKKRKKQTNKRVFSTNGAEITGHQHVIK